VDVAETDDHLLVRAELAGARGEDIRVMLSEDGRRLTIKGTRGPQDVVDDASNRYHQLEIDFGDFERVVNLPDRALEPRGVRAQYRNGFLVVVLPKRASQGGHVVKKRISVRISAPDSDPTP
jgi:HSP20 family protein